MATGGVVQKVTFLGNTDNVNFGWFAYDSTDGHPKKCYYAAYAQDILDHMSAELPEVTDWSCTGATRACCQPIVLSPSEGRAGGVK